MAAFKLNRIVFALCALALMTLPRMAGAQSSSTFVVPFDRTGTPGIQTQCLPDPLNPSGPCIPTPVATGAFDNPCTGEWVDITGSSTITITSTAKDAKGEFKISVSVTSRGSGFGWTSTSSPPDYTQAIFTGSTYAFVENQSFRATVPFLLTTEFFESGFSDKFSLKGQGPTDNWVIRAYFKIKIDGKGNIQVLIERMTGDVCNG